MWRKSLLLAALLVVIGNIFGCSALPSTSSDTDNSTGNSVGGTETGNAEDTTTLKALAISDSIDAIAVALKTAVSQGRLLLTNTSSLCANDVGASETITCDDTTHTANIIADFASGCEIGTAFTITGKRYNNWINMGDTSCSSPTGRPYFTRAFRGAGARQILSTDEIPVSGECNTPQTADIVALPAGDILNITACATFDYANYASVDTLQSVEESLAIPFEHRVRENSSGDTVYDHQISTATPLDITLAKTDAQDFPTQLINTGIVTVVNNVSHFTVQNTFANVQYDLNTCKCQPVSGSVTSAVTDTRTGASLGTGTITFTAATTGTCDTYDATFDGESITLTLESCGGT